jgi:DNA-directed RNA polymerase subunit RPC12/RpoP
LAENDEENKQEFSKPGRNYDACPHCGHELSPWQQVLLSIDRALVCKNCWYRIILDISDDQEKSSPSSNKE